MSHYNPLEPISNLMTSKLVTLSPGDDLWMAKELFDKHKIHHIPVVRYKDIVGILSKTDIDLFYHGYSKGKEAELEKDHLQETRVDEIMTTNLAKLEPSDPIRTALTVFKLNRFHALPVVLNDDLVGIVTTHDIILHLAKEPADLKDYEELRQ